uniref:Cytochrome P450 n=1 Tax=Timema cristinae TaxID=61476 RepID=A0A7R9H3A0_TIMCR|nr:unnamed protein product [Timema cristinae]
MGIVLTILITTIIILIYNRFTNIFSYWRMKRVPFVQPLKVNNKLKDVLLSRIDLEDVFEMVYSELEGHELGGFYKFLQPCLMVRSPDVIETILVTRFDCFHDNWSHVCHEVDPLASRSLFFMTGDRGTGLVVDVATPLDWEGGRSGNVTSKTVPEARTSNESDTIALAVAFFTEAFEKSSAVLSAILLELASNEEIQETLRKEIDTAREQNNGVIGFEMIQGMKYLDMVLSDVSMSSTPSPDPSIPQSSEKVTAYLLDKEGDRENKERRQGK